LVAKIRRPELITRKPYDPFGDGRLGYLTSETVEFLRAWLKASGVAESWIFRRVLGDQVGVSCLHPFTVNRTIKAMADAAA